MLTNATDFDKLIFADAPEILQSEEAQSWINRGIHQSLEGGRTLITEQWNNPENSKTISDCKQSGWIFGRSKCTKKMVHAHQKFLWNFSFENETTRKRKICQHLRCKHFDEGSKLNLRVWSWLRMNAGGVLNTCKSNEALYLISSEWRFCDWVADGWVTRG